MRDRPTGEELLALVERIEGGDGSIILADSAAVGRHLWQTALERVRESSPKVLGPLGLE